MLTWWQKSFKNMSTATKSIQHPSSSDAAIEDFTPNLDSVKDIIDKLVQVNECDRKDRICRRCLKSKLTEKYGSHLLVVTVEQNKTVMVISRASLES